MSCVCTVRSIIKHFFNNIIANSEMLKVSGIEGKGSSTIFETQKKYERHHASFLKQFKKLKKDYQS